MKRKREFLLALGLLVVLATGGDVLPASAQQAAEPAQSLYRRLGGYDAIAAVVDDFIGRLAADPKLVRFFTSLSADSKKRLRQLVVDQLCEATGGPCIYIGRA